MLQHNAGKGWRRLFMGLTAILLLLAIFPVLAHAEDYPTYTVKVDKGYLALRSEPTYDDRNEIGHLYTGDTVRVIDSRSNKTYWLVQSAKYQSPGWVNRSYLIYVDTSIKGDYRVSVASGYLALRSAPAYDSSNEIGQLYTGDVVTLIDKPTSQYWWVYSSKCGKCGYVNKDYISRITSTASYGEYHVKVAKGYLALRNAPAYNDSNEIGQLNNGDVVVVKDTSNGQYWWVYSPKYGKSGYVNKDYLVK